MSVKFSTLADNPDTVLTAPAPGDLWLVYDLSEPLEINKTKVISYQNLINLAALSAAQALIADQAAGDLFYAKTTTAIGRIPNGNKRSVAQYILQAGETLSVKNGVSYFPPMPSIMNGWNVVGVFATILTKSTSGTPTIQIVRGRRSSATSAHTWIDILSTKITIDVNEYSSLTAATQPMINMGYNDVLTDDLYRIDIDVAGTGAKGLFIGMEFQLPD